MNKLYKCDKCDKSYKYSTNLTNHIDSVHVGTRYTCDKCNKSYTKGSLAAHITAIHNKPVVQHKCDKCTCSYKYEASLKRHVATKHNNTRYSCNECTKTFTRVEGLNKHINEIHKGLKPYKCTTCNEAFSQRSNMKKHIDSIHKGVKSYKCPHCNHRCAEKRNLQMHIDIHLGVKSFQCTKCDDSFRQKSHLSIHMLAVHSTEYKFVCENKTCGMLFKTKYTFEDHVKRRHKEGVIKYIKTEEKRIADLLVANNIPFDYNITVKLCDDEKNAARPDFIIQAGGCIIILEVDEHSHGNANLTHEELSDDKLEKMIKRCNLNGYSPSCEQARMTRIIGALKIEGENRPIGFIRYNPHSYKVDGILCNPNNAEREKVLLDVLTNWEQENDLKIQYMYYDTYIVENIKRCSIWDHHEYEPQLLQHCVEPVV